MDQARKRLIRRLLGLFASLFVITPVLGQVATGQTAHSPAKKVGQRQSRSDSPVGAEPLERINSRIQNRISSRIRGRIDRSYSHATSASAIKLASEAARTAGQTKQR